MKQSLILLTQKLQEPEYREASLLSLTMIRQNNQQVFADFILSSVLSESNPIIYANLMTLLDDTFITPEFSVQIIHRLIAEFRNSCPLRLQLGMNSQVQDTNLQTFTTNPVNIMIIKLLTRIGKLQPEVFTAYLLFFWPDELKTPQSKLIVVNELMEKFQGQNQVSENLRIMVNAALSCEFSQLDIKPYSTSAQVQGVAPSSVLVQLFGMCVNEKTAELILPLLFVASTHMQTPNAQINLLLICLRGLNQIQDTVKFLRCNADISVYFVQFLLHLHSQTSVMSIKILSHCCIYIISSHFEQIELMQFLPQLTQQTMKLFDVQNTSQFVQQILNDLQAAFKSPFIQSLLGQEIQENVWGEIQNITTQKHAYFVASLLPVNVKCLFKLNVIHSNLIDKDTNKFIKSSNYYPITQPITSIQQQLLTTQQVKQFCNQLFTMFWAICQGMNQLVFVGFRQNLVKLFIEILNFSPQVLIQFIQSQQQNIKAKVIVLQLLDEVLKQIKSMGLVNNYNNFSTCAMQFVLDILNFDFKYVVDQSVIKHASHDVAFYTRDISLKTQLEPQLANVAYELLHQQQINNLSDPFYQLINFLLEAHCGIVSQKDNEILNLIIQLSQQYSEEFYYITCINVNNRMLKLTGNESMQIIQIQFQFQYNLLCLLEFLGKNIDAQKRFQIMDKAGLSFPILFSKLITYLVTTNRFNEKPIISLIRQISQQTESHSSFYGDDEEIQQFNGSFSKSDVDTSYSEYIRYQLSALSSSLEKCSPKNSKQRTFTELFPGQRWRTYHTGIELETNLQNINHLFKKQIGDDDDDEDGDSSSRYLISRSVSRSQNISSLVDVPTSNNEIDLNDRYWIVLQTSINNILSVSSIKQNNLMYQCLQDQKYYKYQTELFYKQIYNRIVFMSISKQCEKIELSYEQLNGSKLVTDQQTKDLILFLQNLIVKISSDQANGDDLKFLLQVISSTNLHLSLMILRNIKLISTYEMNKLSYTILVHSISVMSIKCLITTLNLESDSKSNSSKPNSIFVPKFQVNKYILEILCNFCVDFCQTTLYKSIIATITNIIKSIRYISVFTQIDQNQINNSLLPLIQQLFLIGGFMQVEGINSQSKIIPTDNSSKTYQDLAQFSNYSNLLNYFKDSTTKFPITLYKLQTQYQAILSSQETISSSEKLYMDGQTAPICKLHQQILDAFIELLLFVKLPTEVRRLILVKSLGIVRQHQKPQSNKFVEYQLVPRVLMVCIRLLESQTSQQQFYEIIQIFGDLIINQESNISQLYSKILSNFLLIAKQVVMNTPYVQIVLNKCAKTTMFQYLNPVMNHIKYNGSFGRLQRICDYILPFLLTGQFDIIEQLCQFDQFMNQVNDKQINDLEPNLMGSSQYICKQFYQPDQVTDFCLTIIQSDKKWLKNVQQVLSEMYIINDEYFKKNIQWWALEMLF
ncbi:Conserved_hypothetical protein [Hexamita inflata]|uniref:Uncharacterized protein n=1 Tax=Hexamita inflata TaxID=28002 RepID=A0AA86P295_9EUKA|nr:Conserved hypothetical protein [Hexamita inflata]